MKAYYLKYKSDITIASSAALLQYYLTRLQELRGKDDRHNGMEHVLPFMALMKQLAPADKPAPFLLDDYLYP